MLIWIYYNSTPKERGWKGEWRSSPAMDKGEVDSYKRGQNFLENIYILLIWKFYVNLWPLNWFMSP